MISPAQSRAARALLNWSQEQLSSASLLSRSTIADFERETRVPSEANLRSIEEAFYVNGIELLPDQGKLGEGVRRREVKIVVIGSPSAASNDGVQMQLRYRGEPYRCIVSREALEDFGSPTGHIANAKEAEAAAERLLTRVRAISVRKIEAGDTVDGRQVYLRSRDFYDAAPRIGNALDPAHPHRADSDFNPFRST